MHRITNTRPKKKRWTKRECWNEEEEEEKWKVHAVTNQPIWPNRPVAIDEIAKARIEHEQKQKDRRKKVSDHLTVNGVLFRGLMRKIIPENSTATVLCIAKIRWKKWKISRARASERKKREKWTYFHLNIDSHSIIITHSHIHQRARTSHKLEQIELVR